MLEMRPGCECCDKDLPNGAPDARICTFECTWCLECIEGHLGGRCPNCGGNHVERPTRPVGLLEAYPVSTIRVHNPRPGCTAVGRSGPAGCD